MLFSRRQSYGEFRFPKYDTICDGYKLYDYKRYLVLDKLLINLNGNNNTINN